MSNTKTTGEFDRLRKQTQFTMIGDCGLKYTPGVFAPGAKCPNHGCRLYLTDQPGKGMCEISTCYFDYDEGPYIAGDQSANSAREVEIKLINGQYQKVFRTATSFTNNQILKK